MKGFVLAVLLLALSLQAYPADLVFPKLTGRIVDEAGLISAGDQRLINAASRSLEQTLGHQLVVVTVKDLQGVVIEDFGYQLGRHWGIGQAETNNGVLLIVAQAERKVRVEVGYGLEGDLTDARSSQIIQGIMLPRFKAGQVSGGIAAGSEAIRQVFQGEFVPPKVTRSRTSGAAPPMLLGVFFVLWLLSKILGSFAGGMLGVPVGTGRRHRGGYIGGVGGFGGGAVLAVAAALAAVAAVLVAAARAEVGDEQFIDEDTADGHCRSNYRDRKGDRCRDRDGASKASR